MTKHSAQNPRLTFLFFLLLVVGGGFLIGFLAAPGEWYAGLAKPSFNPPNWVFAPVWTVIYVLVAMAGWRTFKRHHAGWPIRLWWAQLALNFLWSPVFFAAHRIGFALAVILLLFAAILGFMGASWRQDRTAAWLFVPYAAWVAFASALNAAIFAFN
jgi:tryptophan-rich sensory protein